MLRKVVILFIFLFSLNLISAANIFDFLWDTNSESLVEKGGREDDSKQTCTCNGPTCNCCVDFNLTYVDLGGPGCVEMEYISQNDGLNLSVSYGEHQIHSEHVKISNPRPICMALLENIAEICARFSILEPHNNGLRGCLLLEPKILGDIQTQFDIGCFLMASGGMQVDPNSNSTIGEIIDNVNGRVNNSQTSDTEGFSEDDLMAVVDESAEKGLLFFGNLLGLAFGKTDSEKSVESNGGDTASIPENIVESTQRKSKNLSSQLNRI